MRVRRCVLWHCSSIRHVSAPSPHKSKTQIAIIGSGPSGCYVAQHLIKRRGDIHVDIYESLPVPFGLSRYGVAPDHPEVKNVERHFLDMFRSGRVTWIGNVSIGTALPVALLLEHYAAVVVASGAGASRTLRIPGADLGGVVPARDFVGYYNTYPFPHGAPRFCPFDLRTARNVLIVGNGNVALDCARVLAAPYKRFAPTDMNCVAVRELMHSRVNRVDIVARRGHAHSAFTIAEFRELTRCAPHALHVRVDPFDLEAALRVPAENPRARRRLLELLARVAQSQNEETPQPHREKKAENALQSPRVSRERGPCVVDFRYHMRPLRFLPSTERPRCVGAAVFERSRGEGMEPETITVPCDAVLTSIGYTSDGIAGVAFDSANGVIPNTRGRVTGQSRVYCAGWVKNGARGVILRSLMDAQETAMSIIEDIDNDVIPTKKKETTTTTTTGATEDMQSELSGKFGLIDYFVEKKLEPVSVAGLERIMHVETERGVDLGKRLEKINNVRDMLDVALGGEHGKKANNAIRGITNDRPDALLYLKELLDDTTDLAPFARHLAKDMMPVMAEKHPPGRLDPSQL